ncbi:MAG: TetR/AcrR family transcriptional regulator [Candidatus Cloacimonetes bacterium]|nr:TetR/AcrR family transcriptional regulator [Candidatus Cloacimonadota bacterium]
MIQEIKLSRKERERETRETEILTAARKLFLKNGFVAATMDDLGKESEFSKKTLYSYFQSKEEILIRVFLQAINESHQSYVDAVSNKTTGYDKLTAYSINVYECYKEKPEYLPLYDTALQVIAKKEKLNDKTLHILMSTNELSISLVKDIFELGVKDKTLREDLRFDIAIRYYMVTIQHVAKLFLLCCDFTQADYLTAVEYFLQGFKREVK